LSKKLDDEEDALSRRLHFWAEGREEAIGNLKSVLQARLEDIHLQIRNRLEEYGGAEAWQKKRDSDYEKQKNSWQEWQSRSDQQNWQDKGGAPPPPPPQDWGTDGLPPPPPPQDWGTDGLPPPPPPQDWGTGPPPPPPPLQQDWGSQGSQQDRSRQERPDRRRGGRRDRKKKDGWKEGWKDESWGDNWNKNGSSEKKEKVDIWKMDENDNKDASDDSSDDAWGDFGGEKENGDAARDGEADSAEKTRRKRPREEESSDDDWGDWGGASSSANAARDLPNATAQPRTPPSGPQAQPGTPPGSLIARLAGGGKRSRSRGAERSRSRDVEVALGGDSEPAAKKRAVAEVDVELFDPEVEVVPDEDEKGQRPAETAVEVIDADGPPDEP